MVHLIYNESADVWYSLLLKFKKIFLKGGADRMKHTLPALLFSFLKLSAFLDSGNSINAPPQTNDEDAVQVIKVDHAKIFKSVNEIILALQEHSAEQCLKLYLQAAQAVNNLRNFHPCEDMAYEFMSQALLIYQDEISDADAKTSAINLICSTMYYLNCFSEENHNTLIANTLSSCAQLLKKPQQCEAII
jgi:vacuolar protein sorting-associated protein 35